MAIDLYAAFVPTVRQLLAALPGLIDKAEGICADSGTPASELIEARLAEDMWPLPWHIRSCWVHSGYALDQLAGGAFTPDFTDIPADWDAMRAMVAGASRRMDAATPEEVDALGDRPIDFVLGGTTRFTLPGERFLLGFNMPNFQFHATTFYGLLRSKGVPLSKRDFLGNPAGPGVQS
ncbi:DUF1993 family protein [Tsuneonella sp. SYSU-LHT278]|uniref:DUF1993 family protein n=1 Tax=Tsuneonella sediminis TaxID=3416089 RepID=UPI003F7AE517